MKKYCISIAGAAIALIMMTNCQQKTHPSNFSGAAGEVKLITLAPGHFHAHLVQKSMYQQVDPKVHVYAPEGNEVVGHISQIEAYNMRGEEPTSWIQEVYTGDDYLERMIEERPGNVVILAGNNRKKTQYIHTAVREGLNVLSDKPMAIDTENFELLKDAFEEAARNKVLLYDIMTERYEITTMLQKELMHIPAIFGELEKGSPDDPSVIKESIHHFFKYVSGNILRRPPWYFDINQQGEGIIDVTTHLVDLIQWACFPEQVLDYARDIEMLAARRWATPISKSQFERITRSEAFPDYLQGAIKRDSILEVYANGEMVYAIKGIHARVLVRWDYAAPEGTGDTHYSLMRGTKASLVIRQGANENYKPVLYIEPNDAAVGTSYADELTEAFREVQQKYPGVTLESQDNRWKVVVPVSYDVGHEAHFAQVTEKFLQFLIDGKLPEWEVPNMLAKYYTTTKALEMARQAR